MDNGLRESLIDALETALKELTYNGTNYNKKKQGKERAIARIQTVKTSLVLTHPKRNGGKKS